MPGEQNSVSKRRVEKDVRRTHTTMSIEMLEGEIILHRYIAAVIMMIRRQRKMPITTTAAHTTASFVVR